MLTRLGGYLRGDFASDALRIYLYQAFAAGAGLVLSIALARALGPEGKGAVDLVILVAAIVVQFGMLGVASGFLLELASRKRRLAEIHGDALLVALVTGVVGVVLAFVVWQTDILSRGDLDSDYAVVALLATGVLVYSASFRSFMIGIDRAPTASLVKAVSVSIQAVLAVSLWATGQLSVELAIALLAGTWITTALVQGVVTWRQHPGDRPQPRRESLVRSYRYGLRVFPGHIAHWVHYRVDLIIIAAYVGTSGVGIYAVSVRWAEALWLLGAGLLNAGLYRIASSESRDSREFTWRLFRWTLAVVGAAALVLVVVAPTLIELLYGEDFTEAVIPLIVLVPGVVAWSGVRVLTRFIAMNQERPGLTTSIAIGGATLNIVSTLLLVPPLGILGASIGSTASYTAVLGATLIAFRRV